MVTSTGRFMWIKFTSDEELEGLGFRVKYTFIAGNPESESRQFGVSASYMHSEFKEVALML